MMNEYMDSFDYEVMDECYAVVSSRCGEGVFLVLDNGQRAYAHRFGNLTQGDRVICRVDRLPQGDKNTLVSISSVCGYNMRAA